MRSPSTAAGQTRSAPVQRWAEAVAARPLEVPQPLPPAFHGLSRALTGRRDPARFTTGPATRHALGAAGALGATTGDVVHLPAPPTSAPSSLGLLAHELRHAREPVLRPRFLLAGHDHSPDTDEHRALAIGRSAAAAVPEAGAGLVDALPVGGLGAGVVEVARRAAEAAVRQQATAGATSAPGGPAGAVGGRATWTPAGWGSDGAPGPAASSTGPAQESAPAAAGPGGAPGDATPVRGPAAPGTGVVPDMDRVVEALEQRLLAEMERRGGRWAGVF